MAKHSLCEIDVLTDEQVSALIHSDFATFAQAMFKEVYPGKLLVWDPFLGLICAKLEDVAHGRIKRLIITLPPRHGKSYLVSAALPAFILGHYPSEDIMDVSYGQDLSQELARQTETIMQSALYRRVFGEVLIKRKQPLHLLRTSGGGIRRATSIEGTATGAGADVLIFDDPQKPGEVLSDTIRRSSNAAYENTFASRGNNPGKTRSVVVMQRLHEDDFVGHLLSRGEWEVLNLPAIAESNEAIRYADALGEHTFRRREGEALHPRRIPVAALRQLQKEMGEAAWATQFQQRPAPPGGGVVNTAWFKRYDAENPPLFDRKVQSWDTASSVKPGSDWSVCTTFGIKGKDVYLLDVYRARLEFPELKAAIIARGRDVQTVVIEDCGSGTSLYQQLRRENFGKIYAVRPLKDKKTRMENQTAFIENGFVYIPHEAEWLTAFLHELAVFPNGRHDDQVDSLSQALDYIQGSTGASGWYGLALEHFAKKAALASASV